MAAGITSTRMAPRTDAPMTQTPAPVPHTLSEDFQALLVGPLFMALAVVFFKHAGLLVGGTAGAAFLLHYLSGWRFGLLYFALNLPFYFFAYRVLGAAFTLKTFVAVGLLSLYSEVLPHLITISDLEPAFAAVMAGLLAGIAILILIRHKSSLGGLNVLAIYLQEKHAIRAGHFQMVVDCCIVLASFFVVSPTQVALSVVSAVVLNMVLAVNHRPGRYIGF